MELNISTRHVTCPSGNDAMLWGLPSGMTVDLDKLPDPNAVVGDGLALNGAVDTYTSAHAIVAGVNEGTSTVALKFNFNVVTCLLLGDGGIVRLNIAVPIDGWQVSDRSP